MNSLNDESIETLFCAKDYLHALITCMLYLYYYCTEIKSCVNLQILVDKLVIHCGVIKLQQMIPYVAVEDNIFSTLLVKVSVFSFELLLFVASCLLSCSANLLFVCQ
jgi:hypothetical protein